MANNRRRCDFQPCNKQYRPKRSTSMYCSPNCTRAASRERAKNGRPKAETNGKRKVSYLEGLGDHPPTEPPAGAVHGDHGDVLGEREAAVLPVPPPEGESVAEPGPKPKQKLPLHSRECRAGNKGNPFGYSPYRPTGGCEGCEARGLYPEEEGEITIFVPSHFPGTPLNRGRRW